MAESLDIKIEQVDDIPILLAQGKKIGVPELLDQFFLPHGSWKGTSFGWTTLIWLAHILSEGDHRLNQVEAWVEKRPQTLEISTGKKVFALEWSDDRLGIVLGGLANAGKWKAFEAELNRQILRVYDLRPSRVRVDSTTARCPVAYRNPRNVFATGLERKTNAEIHRASKRGRPIEQDRRRIRTKCFVECRNR